mgnify:FL=1
MAASNGKVQYNDLVEQSAIDQVIAAQTEIKNLTKEYTTLASTIKGQNITLMKADGIQETESAIRKQSQSISELEKIKKKLIETENKLAASMTMEAQLLAEQRAALRDSNNETAQYVKIMHSAEGSVDQMRGKLEVLRKQFYALSESMRLGGQGQKMLADIQKLDSAVKMATFSTGKFTDNVGNYSSATFQLTQTLRELPAFAYSTQTGIMGISNNLPILADAFRKVKAETGSAWQALKIFGSSLFSFGNIFAVAVGLLTIFSDKIFAADKGMKQAAKSADDFKTSQDALNAAIASSEYKKAVQDINELRINIDLARKGFVDKTDVVNMYNATLGDTLGKVKTLDEAEKMLVKNGEAYIQMTLLKAAANLSLEKAAQEYLKAELKSQEAAQKLAEGTDSEGNFKAGAIQSFKLLFSQGLGSDKDNFQKQTKQEVDGIKKEGDRFKEISSKFQEDAAKLAKAMGMDLFGKEYDVKQKKEKKPKIKPNINPNLSDSDLADLKAYYENIRKWQMEKLGDMVNDPESRKLFDEFILGETLSGDKSVSDAEAERISNEIFDRIKKNIEKKAKNKKLILQFEMVVDAVKNANDALTLINDIQYNREMQQIENRNKALEASYDMEKKQIESRGLTQQQKANELANLEARREAERKRIDRERITAERRRALQQKGIDIANIISSGALAIVKQLAATPLPAGAPAVALVAATNGIALARAIAAPIPQYKHGTESHPGGLAEVGDGGQHELVTTPDGKKFITPNTSSIMDLPVGAKVKPLKTDELMKAVYDLGIVKLANMPIVSTNEMQQAMIDSMDDMTKTMKGVKNEIGKLKHSTHLHGDIEHFFRMKKIIS